MSPSNSRRWRTALLIALGSIALLLVGLTLYQRGRAAVDDLSAQIGQLRSLDMSGETLYEWADDDARDVVAPLRGFRLPDTATALMLARQGQTRPTYWLRFSLPTSALDAFFATTCLPPLTPDDRPAFRYGGPDIIANLPWWQPDTAQTFAGGECVDASGVHFRLLADFSDSATATVYLEIAPE